MGYVILQALGPITCVLSRTVRDQPLGWEVSHFHRIPEASTHLKTYRFHTKFECKMNGVLHVATRWPFGIHFKPHYSKVIVSQFRSDFCEVDGAPNMPLEGYFVLGLSPEVRFGRSGALCAESIE